MSVCARKAQLSIDCVGTINSITEFDRRVLPFKREISTPRERLISRGSHIPFSERMPFHKIGVETLIVVGRQEVIWSAMGFVDTVEKWDF